MTEQLVILNNIAACRAEQAGLFQALESLKRSQAITGLKISAISVQIELLEDELWWLSFIRFCNTPCWRYTC